MLRKKGSVIALFLFLMGGQVFAAHNEPKDPIFSLGEDAIPRLIEAASTLDPNMLDIKIKAIQRLGQLKAKAAVPAIIDALGYGSETIVTYGGGRKVYNWKIRLVSAKALAEINDKRAVKPLAMRAYQDQDVIVQRAAVQALGLMGETARTTQVLRFLYRILERTQDNALVSDICDALGKIGDKSAFVPLLRVTQGVYLNYVKERAQKAIAMLNWDQPSVFDKLKNKSASKKK